MNLLAKSRHNCQLSLGNFFLSRKVNIKLSLMLFKGVVLWLVLHAVGILSINRVQAQIVPAPDGTNTIVTPNGNQIDINGGQLSQDRANLFHTFTQFGLNAEQIANFLANPQIQNILGRVVGGDPSIINGKIQITGSNANLFLMNPAGIVFGSSASLNVPGAFTATTANGIGFGSNFFSATGANNYAALIGNPDAFSFSMSQSGAIFNAGNLTVGEEQNLTLLGGTVANTGSLSAPKGQIIVSAVPGEKLVRLSQPGSPLSLEIQPLIANGNQAQSWSLPILSLPQLLTSAGGNATKLAINSDGTVKLLGSDIAVANGDVVTGNVTAKTANLSANRNLTAVESQLNTTGDLKLLARDTVRVRDSAANPFIAKAGGNLLIQGNQQVDIFALNNSTSGFFSGGDMVLRSFNTVGGDAHFTTSGNFRIEKLDGSLGSLFSPYDPVVRASGDVNFQSYTGASLHIFAGGSVNIPGGVTINSTEEAGNIDGKGVGNFIAENDVPLSDGTTIFINGSNRQTLDIRAGTTAFGTPGISDNTDGFFAVPPSTGGAPTSANITIGNIQINDNGVVFLTNQYNPNRSLPTGLISTQQINAPAGSVTIDSRNTISTTEITIPGRAGLSSGDIKLISAAGDINTTTLDTSGFAGYGGGVIALNANGNIITGAIDSSGYGGGAIAINSNNGNITTGNIDSSGLPGGALTLNSGGNVRFDSINTRGYFSDPGGSVNIFANGVVQGIGLLGPTVGEDDSIPGNTTIFTRGTPTPGSVRIQHNGGSDNVPFIVGNATLNGTAGGIDAGANSVISSASLAQFPVLPNGGDASGTPNPITINSVNSPPTLTANPPLRNIQQNQPLKFTYTDLNANVNDVNGDNTFLRIDAITAGKLTINGVEVVPRTQTAILSPGDTLEYTPPQDFSGELNPFSFSASDRVSSSTSQQVRINVTATPKPPDPELPPREITKIIERTQPPISTLPLPNVDGLSPISLDPAIEDIDNKFADQYYSYAGEQPRDRRRVSLSQARDILRQIEKATGVKPAIIYASFTPSGVNGNVLGSEQDSDQLNLVIVTAKGEPISKTISTAKRGDVLKIAEQLYSAVEDGEVIANDPKNEDYLEPAQQLYKLMVAPLKAELDKRGINNLLFVADEGLRSLPFATLHDGKQFGRASKNSGISNQVVPSPLVIGQSCPLSCRCP